MTNKSWSFRPWTRHSLVLVVAGLYYIGIGLSFEGYIPYGPRWNALVVARHWMSLDNWALVFIMVGMLSIFSAFWPRKTEVWGYALLTGLSTLWAGFHVAGILFENSSESNWSIAFTWGLVAFMWWAISGLVSPTAPSAVRNGPS